MSISQEKSGADLRTRLSALDSQITQLREIHLKQGDRLAGRLMTTVEQEREKVLAQLGEAH
jgi:hypothetical protein